MTDATLIAPLFQGPLDSSVTRTARRLDVVQPLH
ncbi:MAG: hypothetical protein RL026_576 [Pseudomonadota bacterium]